jgi:thioredoxin 1
MSLPIEFIPTTIDNLITYSKSLPSKLIILDFKASWCAPCKTIKPFVEYLKEHYTNVAFYEIDIEDEDTATITKTFDIKKLPTFIYYKNGEVCKSLIGINKGHIEEFVNEYL